MKYLVAITIVLVDSAFFIVPLGALFLAYVLIAKPKWFFDWAKEI